MIRDEQAMEITGMPIPHGEAFQRVSDAERCVIAVRAVGRYATGLLLENYAAKGFHNKAKSCDWGPMAGFVMADPRFSKNPDVVDQADEIKKAIKHGAGLTALRITDERRMVLERELRCITPAGGGNDNEMIYIANNPEHRGMNFVLHRIQERDDKGKRLWQVCNANAGPLMAMVDPNCPGHLRETYRSATTSDHDLWALFPQRTSYSGQKDNRMVPGSNRFRLPLQTFSRYEDSDGGNLTERIRRIIRLINNAIIFEAGYRGGNVVHHSSEAGRPGISSIDFPFIAFVPHRPAFCVNDVEDLREFIFELGFKYVLSLNPGWFKQLGIGASSGGSYIV